MHEKSSPLGIAAGPLLDLMTQQADAERASIIAASQSEAEAIHAQAQQEAASLRERTLRAVEAELSASAQRSRERAEAEAHMAVLTTKDTIASEILEAAKAELQRIASGPDVAVVIESLLAEVLDGAEDGVNVLAPAAHTGTVSAWLEANGRGHLQVVAAPELKDGVAIQDAAKTYRVTNTLSARFDRLESALRRSCIEQLFGGEN